MLTNILCALPTEAEKICLKEHSSWPHLEFNGLDNAALAALLSALGAANEAAGLEGEQYLIFMADDNGPWVFHLPEIMMAKLATLPPQEAPAVAEKWVKSEELAFHNFSAADVEPIINQLRDLSSEALAQDKQLILWMSL